MEANCQWLEDAVGSLGRRAELLRSTGKLSEQTLRAYFGDKRFEQIAESNAIEGSPLSVGETKLAVLRGVTITGHDPSWSEDAVNLAAALDRMVELARIHEATRLGQVLKIHELILGGASGSGEWRTVPVEISGSPHLPPPTRDQVVAEMEQWERWSTDASEAPALLRAIVLSTWLTHVHPFRDGNGRTSRAVMNLELIRSGLPSVIIRRKDRLRYYEALAESDTGGDLTLIAELVLSRAEDALRDLERAATAHQGFDKIQAALRQQQARKAGIWNDAVRLLFSLVDDALRAAVGPTGTVATRWYEAELSTEDYVALCRGDSEGNSWLFRLAVEVTGVRSLRYLAWTGYRSNEMRQRRTLGPGPSIFWSVPDPTGYQKWIRDDAQAPGVAELTLELPDVDRWIARLPDGEIRSFKPSGIARRIMRATTESLMDIPADAAGLA